ncbi:hypothetical protein A6R68_05112 [Neotoma lepida]|uniref:Fas apoptotic inhibitory molecule 2 n=1 Tax=Neotoma lepida TaxID=56216 RepID=A0A1A6GLY1_NEOLE|nr:hypothetical protein A6R68_05112 [Neotoma lepida]
MGGAPGAEFPGRGGVWEARGADIDGGVATWTHVCMHRKIDLEVSEPINFSSGDHQYLVQKAAIKGGHSKVDQPFTYSSRDTPQEAIKYPRSKQRDGANTYAVQIADDTTSDETFTTPPSPFEDTSVRREFIVKVFVILSVQLLITATIIGMFVFMDIRRQVPANYILLALFTTKFPSILWAGKPLQSRSCLLSVVLSLTWLHLVYSAIGTLIFSMYLVMDVQMMVGGHYHYEISPEEYIFAALNIYVDIINLFVFILDLIAR